MTCPYLTDGRCTLAESLAKRHVSESIECRVQDDTCTKCMASGGPDSVKIPLACVSLATPLIPVGKRVAWAKFTVRNHYGQLQRKSASAPESPAAKGVGDYFAEMLRDRHGAEAYGGCDCNALKVKMNTLGPDGCERECDRLARQVTKNLNASGRWQKILPEWVKDTYFRRLIAQAVEAVRGDQSQKLGISG